MILAVCGASYDAALSDVPIARERKVGFGRRIEIEVSDVKAREALVDRMAEAACDLADVGDTNTVEAIYRDIEKIGA